MTVFEAIKKFKEFHIGDEVIWNNDTKLTVVGLPIFRHRIYYPSGKFTEYNLKNRWEGCKFKTQEVLGYLLEDERGHQFRLHILADLKLIDNEK